MPVGSTGLNSAASSIGSLRTNLSSHTDLPSIAAEGGLHGDGNLLRPAETNSGRSTEAPYEPTISCGARKKRYESSPCRQKTKDNSGNASSAHWVFLTSQGFALARSSAETDRKGETLGWLIMKWRFSAHWRSHLQADAWPW
jgi:hypothetical protein